MLQKSGHIIIVLLLLISTAGISVSGHYCGDTLQSVTVNTLPESYCDIEGCCHNETVTYKIDLDYSLVDFRFESEQIATTIPFVLNIQTVDLLSINISRVFSDLPSPPRLNSYLVIIQTFLL